MCRLALKSANEPFSPYEVLSAMEAMQEGYDGSGLGLLLRGLEFEDFKYKPNFPILSGIAHTEKAWQRISEYMEARGYELKYDHRYDYEEGHVDSTDRFRYFLRAYRMPDAFSGQNKGAREDEMLQTRLALRALADEENNITIFSFYPDVAMIKEVGWPLQIGDGLNLQDGQIKSRVCMAQGRQNTNYGINLNACHPFFIQGISTMTNGENTAFVPIRDWLVGKQIPGYTGYQSDSETLTHILHYTLKRLNLPLQAYKHIITPLSAKELAKHPQGEFLSGLRLACKRLIIDGPNAIIGTLPDETCMLVMDQKKLRPATVGGRDGAWAVASEMCGVEAMVPDRDLSLDFQPMREHTVLIPPHRKELEIWSQYDPFPSALAA